jgi:hypothetical protein
MAMPIIIPLRTKLTDRPPRLGQVSVRKKAPTAPMRAATGVVNSARDTIEIPARMDSIAPKAAPEDTPVI